MKKNQEILKKFIAYRGNFVELIFVAIILGISVNCISSSLYSIIKFDHKNTIFLIAGVVLSLISIGYFSLKLFGTKKINKKIDAFILINNESNELIEIDNYDYQSSMRLNLNMAMSEDEAIRLDWNQARFEYTADKGQRKKGLALINELTEYCLIQCISIHLDDYFNNTSSVNLIKFNRNDIPSILLTNRFLELFSKPMDHRAAFKKDKSGMVNPIIESDGEIISQCSNGAMYSRFDLVLPVKSKLIKDSDGYIVMKTNRFTLKIKANCKGYTNLLPLGYERYYLNLPMKKIHHSFRIDISFDFELNWISFLLHKGWNYYNWVDSLIDTINENFSKEAYFERINWDEAYVIIKSLKQ